jgi:hypothetical protein
MGRIQSLIGCEGDFSPRATHLQTQFTTRESISEMNALLNHFPAEKEQIRTRRQPGQQVSVGVRI